METISKQPLNISGLQEKEEDYTMDGLQQKTYGLTDIMYKEERRQGHIPI